MSKKTKQAKQNKQGKKSKNKKNLPPPMANRQIPISQLRKVTEILVAPELLRAREFPILGCWIMAGWQESGITPVIVAREQAPGQVMFACYMVDLYCLGIKDAFTRTNYTMNRFERELPRFCAGNPEKCSVELAHEVVYGSLEFAQGLGFEPHPDFIRQKADLMLDPPDAHPRVDNVVFGKDGKPFYVSGPYDDDIKINRVLSALKRSIGEGNFDFLTDISGQAGLIDEDDFDNWSADEDEDEEYDDDSAEDDNVIDYYDDKDTK
jgi:hypothetical protein